MDWRNLALKNIWHNMRRYLGYLLSSTMAVTIFSMFFLFIFNPAANALDTLHKVAIVMDICIVIVALFAIFFIFYFHSSLIRLRNKEFGLLMTLGMTPGQIGRLIFFESLCIGLAALGLGLLLGVVCLQPFQWAMGYVLNLQDVIPFAISPSALLVTTTFFGTVFFIEALVISLRVAGRTPRTLLLGTRTQQTPPRASILMVCLGFLCLGAGYDLALQFSSWFLLDAIPIVVLTIIGTFLLFSQILVLLLGWLRKRSLHGVHLLIVARPTYRIKDYARMLAVVTVLSAMVLTGMGTVFSFVRGTQINIQQTHPLDIQLTAPLTHPFQVNMQQMHDALVVQHLDVQDQLQLSLLTGKVDNVAVTLLSLSQFAQLREAMLQAHPGLAIPVESPLAAHQAHVYVPVDDFVRPQLAQSLPLSADHTLPLRIGSATRSFQVDQGNVRVINQDEGIPDKVVVVNDQEYAQMQQTASSAQQWHLYSFHFPNAQQTLAALQVLQTQIGGSQNYALAVAFSNIEALQIMAALLFAGCFVSLLFLFAAGSALYFKLFSHQEEDRRQFHALARVGLQKREAVHIISIEFVILFFLPVLIAVLHSSVATFDLIFLVGASPFLAQVIWSAVAITCLVYATCFASFFGVALVNYFRRVRVATV